jgi:uncharacterized repeat protein (TIGR01451 family)
MVDANSSVDFHTQIPANGKIVFDMGSDNIQDSTVATGDYCVVKTGTKTIEVGERVDTIQVYQGKVYDARSLDWFVFKERQQLLDRNGNTVEETDKGVSLPDLQTIADETDLKVDFKAGTIAFTNTIVWFKVENGLPKDPYILANGLQSNVTTTGTLPGTVPAGTQMGFLLVGATAPHNPLAENPTAKLRFSGTTLQYSTDGGASWNDVPETKIVYSIKEWNRFNKESVVAGISDHPTKDGEKVLTIVFEDIVSGGDRDFEDVHCTVYMKGVTELKTKVTKITKEVDVYTEIPCGNCTVTVENNDTSDCPEGYTRYSVSNGSPEGQNYHVWMPSLFIDGQTARMTFEKEAYFDVKKDGSSAHLYGYAIVTGSGGSSMGARYLVDVSFKKAGSATGPKITNPDVHTPEVTSKWQYFVIDDSNATITSEDGNQVFKLTHMPANEQFGLQVGQAASTQSLEFGLGGWFFWEEVGTGRKGTGDFFIKKITNLCPPQTCPDDETTRYEVSNGSPDGQNYHVWMPSLFIDGQTARMTFDKDAYLDVKKDGSSAHLYGYATVTGSGGSSMGARYLVDVSFKKAGSATGPKITDPAVHTPEVTSKWQYFIIDDSNATISSVDGNQVFKLTHMPANEQFGLQIGQAASTQSTEFGLGGWFFWEEVGTGRKGTGDFFIKSIKNLCPVDAPTCPENTYRHKVSNAVSDSSHNGNSDHSVWMPNLFVQGQTAKLTFDNDAYMDILKDDSKAHLYGYATVTAGGTNEGDRYLVDVWFNQATTQMVAKKELKPGYQPDAVTSQWKFFEMDETKATITKVGGGQVIKLTHKPANRQMGLQVGLTANGKNLKFGASAWFFWEEVGTGRTGHGDFNLDLENLCPDPLPQEADVQVVKTVDQTCARVGDTLTYSIVVTNNGPIAAEGVTLTDNIPAGLNVVAVTGGTFNNNVMDLGTMGVNTSKTITVTAIAASTCMITNIATVASTSPVDPDLSNNKSQARTLVLPRRKADLKVIPRSCPRTIIEGCTVTYYFTVFNRGPYTAENVTIKEEIPNGATLIYSTARDITRLRRGGYATFKVKVRMDDPGIHNISMSASSTTFDPYLANNKATTPVRVRARHCPSGVTNAANVKILPNPVRTYLGVDVSELYRAAARERIRIQSVSVKVTSMYGRPVGCKTIRSYGSKRVYFNMRYQRRGLYIADVVVTYREHGRMKRIVLKKRIMKR